MENTTNIEKALEDIKLIRGIVDKLHNNDSFRSLLRPMLLFAFAVHPLLLFLGVVGQWAYQEKSPLFWGFDKKTFLELLLIITFSSAAILKQVVFYFASKNRGYKLRDIWYKMFIIDGYARISFSLLFLVGVFSWYLFQIGHGHQIVSTVLLGAGSIMILFPLAFPLKELTPIGFFYLFAGAFSFFYFPQYPFYKLAVFFGTGSLAMGWVGLRLPRFKKESTP